MTIKSTRNSDLTPGRAGSIEQQLDMVEGGPLRGDEIIRQNRPAEEERVMGAGYNVDMSEFNREGDEESGDDHSSGLQGGDSELTPDQTVTSGLPGDETAQNERMRVHLETEIPAPEDFADNDDDLSAAS